MLTKPSPASKKEGVTKIQLLTFYLTLGIVPCLISCSDFVDNKAPDNPAVTKPPVEPSRPVQTPPPPPQTETEDQRNFRLCEAERMWALNARLIDGEAFRLYQSRNFAPVFNRSGERQSGIEGWYSCKRALQANGFIPTDATVNREPPKHTPPVPIPTPGPAGTEAAPEPAKPTPQELLARAQRSWRLCEAERNWAFSAGLIDANALRLFQERNLAPVFNKPGERQSGMEGWYSCKRALEMNGFISADGSATAQ